jgi:hypothetical protein
MIAAKYCHSMSLGTMCHSLEHISDHHDMVEVGRVIPPPPSDVSADSPPLPLSIFQLDVEIATAAAITNTLVDCCVRQVLSERVQQYKLSTQDKV